MDSLSREKLAHYKNKKSLTNKRISELTALPISTIDKLLSGLTTNPTIETLHKVTKVLGCSLDDVMDYENDPLEGYYADRQTAKIAQAIQSNTELKELLKMTAELSKKDIKFIQTVVRRMNFK